MRGRSRDLLGLACVGMRGASLRDRILLQRLPPLTRDSRGSLDPLTGHERRRHKRREAQSEIIPGDQRGQTEHHQDCEWVLAWIFREMLCVAGCR